jgi:primary-amine oxidase
MYSLLSVLSISSLCLAAPPAAWMRGARQRIARSSELSTALQKRYVNGSACDASGPASFKAPKANVWSGLTDIEAVNVTRWLFEHSGLNLTNSSTAGLYDNTLLLVELNIPNKTDVVPYLDKNGSAPERWAHALLDLRTTDEPTYTDVRYSPKLYLKAQLLNYSS